MDKEIASEIDSLWLEIMPLMAARAEHSGSFHEGAMSPGMRECPGCRLILLLKRLHEVFSKLEDHGKHGIESVMVELTERREIEDVSTHRDV